MTIGNVYIESKLICLRWKSAQSITSLDYEMPTNKDALVVFTLDVIISSSYSSACL